MYLILKVRVDVLVHGHVFDLNGSISMCVHVLRKVSELF